MINYMKISTSQNFLLCDKRATVGSITDGFRRLGGGCREWTFISHTIQASECGMWVKMSSLMRRSSPQHQLKEERRAHLVVPNWLVLKATLSHHLKRMLLLASHWWVTSWPPFSQIFLKWTSAHCPLSQQIHPLQARLIKGTNWIYFKALRLFFLTLAPLTSPHLLLPPSTLVSSFYPLCSCFLLQSETLTTPINFAYVYRLTFSELLYWEFDRHVACNQISCYTNLIMQFLTTLVHLSV